MADKKGYKVISPISHNGKRYEENSIIELMPEEAEALVKAKAIAVPSGSTLGMSEVEVLRKERSERNAEIVGLRALVQKLQAELAAQFAATEPKTEKGKGKK